MITTASAPCPRETARTISSGVVDAAQRTRDGASRDGPIHLSALDVDPDDVAPMRREQLYRDLADEPESDDDDDVPELRPYQANALQRDRANRHERRLLVAHLVRDMNGEVLGDRVHLGVVRVTGTGAGDAVAPSRSRRRSCRRPQRGPRASIRAGSGESSFARTASRAARTPSRLALSTTFFTRSGRSRALSTRLLRARSTIARSVPAEMSDTVVSTKMPPEGACVGGATCARISSPVR